MLFHHFAAIAKQPKKRKSMRCWWVMGRIWAGECEHEHVHRPTIIIIVSKWRNRRISDWNRRRPSLCHSLGHKYREFVYRHGTRTVHSIPTMRACPTAHFNRIGLPFSSDALHEILRRMLLHTNCFRLYRSSIGSIANFIYFDDNLSIRYQSNCTMVARRLHESSLPWKFCESDPRRQYRANHFTAHASETFPLSIVAN